MRPPAVRNRHRPIDQRPNAIWPFFAATYTAAWLIWMPAVIPRGDGPSLALVVLGAFVPSTMDVVLTSGYLVSYAAALFLVDAVIVAIWRPWRIPPSSTVSTPHEPASQALGPPTGEPSARWT